MAAILYSGNDHSFPQCYHAGPLSGLPGPENSPGQLLSCIGDANYVL